MIYIVLIIVLFLLFICEYRGNKEIAKKVFWIGTVLFVSLFAFRGENVGGDMQEYCLYFAGKESSTYGSLRLNDNIEIGFRWICKALQKVSLSGFWFIFSTSLITLIPFILLVKKYSLYPNLSYLYVICSNFSIMVVCLETHIRQNIASAFIMMALYLYMAKQLNKKRFIWMILFCIAGILTHSSIYYILPLILILNFIRFTKVVSLVLVIGSCILTISFNQFFSQIFTSFMMLLSPYEAFNNMTRYMDSDTYGLSGTAGLINNFWPIALFAIINIYYANKEEINNIFMKCLVVGTSISIMATSFGLSFRMMYALILIGYCYIPRAFKTNKIAMLINFLPLLYMFIRIIRAVFNPASYNTDSHYLPYSFIFE